MLQPNVRLLSRVLPAVALVVVGLALLALAAR